MRRPSNTVNRSFAWRRNDSQVQQSPLSVGDLTRYLQELISSDEVLTDLWIEGEVIDATVSRAGHCYFTVADEDAKLKCVLFRGALQRQSYRPTPGQSCAVHGAISVYAKEGQYQLIGDFVRAAGIGLVALEFELLKQQLTAEGLFDPGRKRPLPLRIRTVGLVTSAEGAVRHDVETVMRRRNPLMHLILAPAAVQGEAAAASLQSALRRLIDDGRSDVIIIGRGGGSASDLAAFNDEALVRAVFASPIPVISAVGHESDWTLLDLVADLRAATPSAAAEIASVQVAESVRQYSVGLRRHLMLLRRSLTEHMLEIDTARDSLSRRGPAGLIPELRRQVESLQSEVMERSQSSFEQRCARIDQTGSALSAATLDRQSALKRQRDHAGALLDVLNPHATLDRGYAVLEDMNLALPVRSVGDVIPGLALLAHIHDGSFITRVEQTRQEQQQ